MPPSQLTQNLIISKKKELFFFGMLWILRILGAFFLCKNKLKYSGYGPGFAQRVRRSIALPFLDRGTTRGGLVSSTPRPFFTPGKYPVPILQEAGWITGPVWTSGISPSHRDSIPDFPVRSSIAFVV